MVIFVQVEYVCMNVRIGSLKKAMVLILKKGMFYTSMNVETENYNKEEAMLAIIFFCYENNFLPL